MKRRNFLATLASLFAWRPKPKDAGIFPITKPMLDEQLGPPAVGWTRNVVGFTMVYTRGQTTNDSTCEITISETN